MKKVLLAALIAFGGLLVTGSALAAPRISAGGMFGKQSTTLSRPAPAALPAPANNAASLDAGRNVAAGTQRNATGWRAHGEALFGSLLLGQGFGALLAQLGIASEHAADVTLLLLLIALGLLLVLAWRLLRPRSAPAAAPSQAEPAARSAHDDAQAGASATSMASAPAVSATTTPVAATANADSGAPAVRRASPSPTAPMTRAKLKREQRAAAAARRLAEQAAQQVERARADEMTAKRPTVQLAPGGARTTSEPDARATAEPRATAPGHGQQLQSILQSQSPQPGASVQSPQPPTQPQPTNAPPAPQPTLAPGTVDAALAAMSGHTPSMQAAALAALTGAAPKVEATEHIAAPRSRTATGHAVEAGNTVGAPADGHSAESSAGVAAESTLNPAAEAGETDRAAAGRDSQQQFDAGTAQRPDPDTNAGQAAPLPSTADFTTELTALPAAGNETPPTETPPAASPGVVVHPPGVPDHFDGAAFLSGAKLYFVRFQAAWDRADEHDLREFTSPDMFEQLQAQLQQRQQPSPGTEVVELEADLLAMQEQEEYLLANVKFTGTAREGADLPAQPFEENWILARASAGEGGWVLAGIGQLV